MTDVRQAFLSEPREDDVARAAAKDRTAAQAAQSEAERLPLFQRSEQQAELTMSLSAFIHDHHEHIVSEVHGLRQNADAAWRGYD